MQRVTSTPDLEAIALPTIVVVDNLVRERLYSVSFVPDRSLIELKALKLYINAYRNVGIFHEFVTNKILSDLVAACQPLRMEIESDFNVRGGIQTVVKAAYERPPSA